MTERAKLSLTPEQARALYRAAVHKRNAIRGSETPEFDDGPLLDAVIPTLADIGWTTAMGRGGALSVVPRADVETATTERDGDWRCECGDLNRDHEAFCYRCGAGQPDPEEDAKRAFLVSVSELRRDRDEQQKRADRAEAEAARYRTT